MTNQEQNKEVLTHLEEVVNICADGYKGYSRAAENLSDPELRTVFNRLSQQRKMFAEELKEDARKLGHEIESEGTTAGYFHRNWLAVKDTFSTTENKTVIDTSLTGEKKAVEVFESAISPNMPKFINDRLEKQLQLVKGAVRQLNELEVH